MCFESSGKPGVELAGNPFTFPYAASLGSWAERDEAGLMGKFDT